MAVALEPATSIGLDELATLFTSAYEGYFVPFQIDEPTLRFMAEALDLDLSASLVARSDGELVGLANLGIRNDVGWVGGIGVTSAARRRGVAAALMDGLIEQARTRGVRHLTLEVIEQNEPAFRLYEKLGFETTRWLEIWSLAGADGSGSVEEVELDVAWARVRDLRRAPEPWQRADETVAHYASLAPPPRGVQVEGAAGIYRPSDTSVQLIQIAGAETACRVLLEGLRAHGQVTLVNLPEGDPASAALRSLGADCRLRQREMLLEL
jgi:ribosomal protein S18 acetylase RimI-like enzyme